MDARVRRMRRGHAAAHRVHVGRKVRSRGRLVTVHNLQRRRAGHAFLQKQLCGPHHWLPVETPHHALAEQAIAHGHQAHALVVRHVGAHHGRPAFLDQAVARIVDGFVKTVAAFDIFFF